MLFENAFKCTFNDCLNLCVLFGILTFIILVFIHIYIYYRLAKLAESKYGDEPLPSDDVLKGRIKDI